MIAKKSNKKKLNGKTLDEKIEELAVIVAQGFAEMVTKKEFEEFRIAMYDFRDKANKRFFELETEMRQMALSISS